MIPTPILILVVVVLVIWLPFRSTETGRGCYAVGSAEGAAYMSGLNVERSRIAAYTLAGLFAGIGGLYLAFQTGSGNADVPQAGAYTLNSIAASTPGTVTGTTPFGDFVAGRMQLNELSDGGPLHMVFNGNQNVIRAELDIRLYLWK